MTENETIKIGDKVRFYDEKARCYVIGTVEKIGDYITVRPESYEKSKTCIEFFIKYIVDNRILTIVPTNRITREAIN